MPVEAGDESAAATETPETPEIGSLTSIPKEYLSEDERAELEAAAAESETEGEEDETELEVETAETAETETPVADQPAQEIAEADAAPTESNEASAS